MNPFRFLPSSWKERLRRRAGAITFLARLENLRRAGFAPQTIIDAGAFHGEWTQQAFRVFPAASFLLIEPQPELTVPLQRYCASLPDARVVPALLGREAGHAAFLIEGSNSRVTSANSNPDAPTLPVTTLQQIVSGTQFANCDLLKLDLQGHELEALAGAGDLFGKAEVIICEVSWLRIGNVPLAEEVIATFAARGYRLYDVYGWNYRPLDGALWQTVFIFVRTDSPLIHSLQWS